MRKKTKKDENNDNNDIEKPNPKLSNLFIRGTINGLPCEINPKNPCINQISTSSNPSRPDNYCDVCTATMHAKALIAYLTKAHLKRLEKDILSKHFPEMYNQKRSGRPRLTPAAKQLPKSDN